MRPIRLARVGLSHGAREWYPRAEATVQAIAREAGAEVGTVASVMALLSPLRSVRDNVRLTQEWFRKSLRRRLPPSTVASLNHYLATGDIRGPKTRAFAHALSGDIHAIVLDRHMGRALLGADVISAPDYRRLSTRLRGLATRLGETPRDTQAAIWLAWQIGQGRTPGFMTTRLLEESV